MRHAFGALVVLGLGGCPDRRPACELPPATLTVRANLDDDDGDGRIDGLQEPVPANDDELVMLELGTAPRCGARLSTDALEGEVRLWRAIDAGWARLDVNTPLSTADAVAVEVVRGRSAQWSGRARLTASPATGGVRLETPPVLLRAPGERVTEVWAAEISAADFGPTTAALAELEAVLPRDVRLVRLPASAARGDRWVQDAFAAGTTGGHPLVVRLPRASSTRALSALDFSTGLPHPVGLLSTGALSDSRFDWGGNIEVLAPHLGFERGRLIWGGADGDAGTTPSAEVTAFFEAQAAQVPAVRVSTGWLWSGHVDDVVMPLPSAPGEVRVLMPSVALGLAVLRPDDREAVRFNAECQRELDTIEAELRAALSGTRLVVVRLPLLFASRSSGGRGYAAPAFANPVNALVLGRRVILGAPDAGRSSEPVRRATEDALRDAGLEPAWVDVGPYFPRGGSVHCAVEALTASP